MKIALVHDQLQEFGGAERVLVSLKKIFPESHVFTSFYNPKSLGSHAQKFKDWKIITSWADKVPFLKKIYSPLRFITPLIWESFDFSKYDLVISSSGAYMSKGAITKLKTLHISYIHHQPKYLYYYETPTQWQKHKLIKIYGNIINHDLRIWDYVASQRPNYLIVNSLETQKRIEKFYRRKSTVIYPPVEIPKTININNFKSNTKNYYITLSRLSRPKHIDVLIKAANKMKFNLKIIGAGRDEKRLRQIAGKTCEFIKSIPDNEFSEIFKYAKAFLFASVDEEFGISPIEALGYGVPVIAYSSGGLKETIINGKNGYLFNKLNENSLIEKIKILEDLSQDKYTEIKRNARKSALSYTQDIFKNKILDFVNSKMSK